MEFQSWAEYAIFAEFVKCKARYVLDERSKRFLEVVLKTSGKRNRTLPQRSKLWRAQIGHGWRTEQVPSWAQADFGGATGYMMPHPFGCKRMLPQLDRATEGRANPTGIPCVYFAMEKETAMSEVRPWIGSHISLAQFEGSRELHLVDCTADDPGFAINYHTGCEEPTAEKRESSVWAQINFAFSEPVTRSDDFADYAPTQLLAETFREHGYDGIIYESRLGEGGKNVAIFRIDCATLVSRRLYQVEEMKFKFSPISAEVDSQEG